jgi:hypothetical protein
LRFHFPESSVAVAVCGLRVKSEHEDECCVIVEPLDGSEADVRRDELQLNCLVALQAKGVVSKGARPDRLAVDKIPLVASKGVVDVSAMVKFWTKESS